MEVRVLKRRALPIVPPTMAATRITAVAVIANFQLIARFR
jgi:hypothetical protein